MAGAREAASFFLALRSPLASLRVTTVSRLRFMGVRAAGHEYHFARRYGPPRSRCSFAGIAGWILSVPGRLRFGCGLWKVIYFLSFLCGGVLYAIGFWVFFAAGVSVTSYFVRFASPMARIPWNFSGYHGENFSWFSLLIAYPANFFHPDHAFLPASSGCLLAAVGPEPGVRKTVQPASTGWLLVDCDEAQNRK